jgi:hypothetical protein
MWPEVLIVDKTLEKVLVPMNILTCPEIGRQIISMGSIKRKAVTVFRYVS